MPIWGFILPADTERRIILPAVCLCWKYTLIFLTGFWSNTRQTGTWMNRWLFCHFESPTMCDISFRSGWEILTEVRDWQPETSGQQPAGCIKATDTGEYLWRSSSGSRRGKLETNKSFSGHSLSINQSANQSICSLSVVFCQSSVSVGHSSIQPFTHLVIQ